MQFGFKLGSSVNVSRCLRISEQSSGSLLNAREPLDCSYKARWSRAVWTGQQLGVGFLVMRQRDLTKTTKSTAKSHFQKRWFLYFPI